MTKTLFTLILAFCSLTFASVTHAADQGSPVGGMSPEVIAALRAINMDAEQKPKFGAAMVDFSAQMKSMTKRVMRSRKTDKPRIIKRKAKSLFKQLDEPMKAFLRDEQWPAYLKYKQAYAAAAL